MRLKRTLAALVITTAILCINLTPAYADTQYLYKDGSIDGYSYVLQITGNTLSVTGSTFYAKSNCSRSVNVTGTYISTSFTGTKTVKRNIGNGYGEVHIAVTVPSKTTDRFIQASCLHTLDGWSITTKATIK